MTLALLIALPMGCPGFGNQVPDVGDVSEFPTWEEDVSAIMASDCTSCHGSASYQNNDPSFRLDVYDSDGQVAGAYDMADRIVARAVDGEGGYMPLGSSTGVDDAKKLTLERWLELGAPETAADLE
ncbi:MAG: hypothetical protein ACOZNI_35575 [Myxococcota bacterium]